MSDANSPTTGITAGGDITGNEFTIEQQIQKFEQYFLSLDRPGVRLFAIDTDTSVFTSEQAEDLNELFVGEPKLTERLLGEIEQRRVLLVTGEVASGRATLALYLSSCLASRKNLEHNTRLVKALDQNVRIDVRAIAADYKNFGGRATVFRDVLACRNRALLSFFSRTDRVGWDELSETLRDNDAYLLFTARTEEVVAFRARLTGHIVQQELPPLPRDLVLEGLTRKVARLKVKRPDRLDRLTLVSADHARVVDVLGALAVVSSFIDDFVRNDSDLASSLSNFRKVDDWFCSMIQKDFEAWCSILTLALCQPMPDSGSIAWLDFEVLRRAFTSRISRNIPADEDDAEEKEKTFDGFLPQLFDDMSLLQRSRAEVTRDPGHLGDVVQFNDVSYASELWKTLLSRYRRILTLLIPELRAIAERDHPSGNISLRMLAAQIIGRIGDIDPFRLSLPLIRRWASSSDRAHRPLVGRLVQGALASGNPVYYQAVLDELEMLTDRNLASSEDAAQDRLVTAISAYAQLGVYDRDVAMKALGSIAIEPLAPAFAGIHKIWRDAETAELQAGGSRHRRAAEGFERRYRKLARIVLDLSVEQTAAVIALQMAIIQLSLRGDPIEVLSAIRDWIARGGPQTGVLLAVLLFPDLAMQLHRPSLALVANAPVAVSPLFASLSSGSQAVAALAGFLADLCESIAPAKVAFKLPAELQRDLQEGFSTLLLTWGRDAADSSYRQPVADLFCALAEARGGLLRPAIDRNLAALALDQSYAVRSFAGYVRAALD